MKKIYVPFAIAFLFLINSCKKDAATDPIPSSSRQDTLTTGWKKILVDTSETYADVFFNNSTTGYLVGNKTYKSTDGGLSWNSISNQSFVNLAVTSNGNAFFAGSNSNGLYKSTNGTGPLTKVKVSTLLGSDVFFVDDNNGYYLDEGGLFNSTDGGANWTKVTTAGVNFAGSFPTLFFSNNNTGWITSQNTVYKTNGSTSNWVAASFTGKAPSTLFTSVFTTLDNTVYTLGNNAELYKSTNGGTSFSLIQTFQTTGGYFGDICFVDNNTGYVSGGNKIFKTTDAGSTWTVVVTLADTQIVEIHFSDAHHGWASCAKGTVLVYNN